MSPHLYERYKNYDWWDKLAPTGREVIFDKTTLELLHSVYLTHLRKKSPTSKAEGYRRMVFDDNISYRAKEIFEYIAPNYHITLQEWNHDKDHVHILFKAHPKSELSKFINAYKSANSRLYALHRRWEYVTLWGIFCQFFRVYDNSRTPVDKRQERI